MHQLPDSGFDRVAPFYDLLARLVFRDAQQQAQKVLLPFVEENSRMLLIGGGSGRLLEQVLETGKNLQIVYLDASPKMISLAKKRTLHPIEKNNSIVEFRVGTEQAIQPDEKFDVVFTPFLLDLFPAPRLSELMIRLQAALKEEGQWFFADFWPVQHPTPLWQKLLLKTMYIFFGAVSGVKATRLPDFKHHFRQLNMQETFSATFYKGMIQAKVFIRQTV